MNRFLGAVLLVGSLSAHGFAEDKATKSAKSYQDAVAPLLETYCLRCHGPKVQKGERRFDMLNGKIASDSDLVDLQDILDLLNLGEMPPQEARQPTVAERRQAIDWLTHRIKAHHQAKRKADGTVSLRRLNSREYKNTLRDLLRLNMSQFDPTATFPRDQLVEHLDNQSDTLVTSGHLLAGYLRAAELAIDKALGPRQRPEVQEWSFTDGFYQQPENSRAHKETHGHAYLTLYEVPASDKHEGAYAPLHKFEAGVPLDGWYRIRIRAEAVNRQHPYDPELFGIDPEEKFRLGVVPGHRDAGELYRPQPIEPLLAEFTLADKSDWYETKVWLDRGYSPRFTFLNGPIDVRNLFSRVIRRHPDLFPKTAKGIVAARINAIKNGKLPQIRIHEVHISGPHFESWPTPSQQRLLGRNGRDLPESLTQKQVREFVRNFANRAYRRPVTATEVTRLMQVFETRSKVRPAAEALADTFKATLCSPHFLHINVHKEQEATAEFALAARLSYFLWSTMPDDELLLLAHKGQLSQPKILAAQVERMLEDERSDDFLTGFLNSWLTLRDLGATPPDRGDFRDFYQYDLQKAMRTESELFARHLLQNNLSIALFLDSDFSFLNKALAKHYGINASGSKQLTGSDFERVTFKDRRRGGLLGQASVLTVTANGIDTSPIVRGVWLLENIFGTPPSPPPPDVEPLDPDVRGAKTIREQLSKHRTNPSCNDCHRKIDPLGFALENFDPIGGWRTHNHRQRIDASGQLSNGDAFADVVEFKAALLKKKRLFARALTTKVLAYAVGRRIEVHDRPHVDTIVETLAEKGYGFRDMIRLVVASDLFREGS